MIRISSLAMALGLLVLLTGSDQPALLPKTVLVWLLVVILACTRGIGWRLSWWMVLPLYAGLSLFWSADRPSAIMTLPALGLVSIAVFGRFQTTIGLKHGLRAGVAWSAVATSVYGLVQRAGLDAIVWDMPGQAIGAWGSTDAHAAFLLLALMIGAFPRRRAVSVAMQVSILLGLLACGSKAALLGLILALVLADGPTLFRSRRAPTAVLLLAVAVFGFWVGPVVSQLKGWSLSEYAARLEDQPPEHRLRDRAFRGKSLSVMLRLSLWSNGVLAAAETPWLGAGLGQFKTAYPRGADSDTPDITQDDTYRPHHAHQALLESAVCFGLPWTVLLCCCVWRRLLSPAVARPLRRAALAQVAMAMVSVNYVYLPILVLLLILRPVGAARVSRMGLAPVVLGACLFALRLIALNAPVGCDPSGLSAWVDPSAAASSCLRADRTEAAIRLMASALERDPWGANTLYNAAVVALNGARRPGDPWSIFAVDALLSVRDRYPLHRRAFHRLAELEAERSWRRFVQQRRETLAGGASRRGTVRDDMARILHSISFVDAGTLSPSKRDGE